MNRPSRKFKLLLSVECLLLFAGIPGLLMWLEMVSDVPFFPVLFGLMLFCLLVAAFSKTFQWRPALPDLSIREWMCKILLRAGVILILLSLYTAVFYPELFYRLPRQKPQLWMLILCLYPLLSVPPQEFLFRNFFMQRYRPLFGTGWTMIGVNALAFAWAHAFFLNWTAPLLSLVAGVLLAATWRRTQSFLWVCFEHALYGQIVFTTGIGWFFYQGSTRALEQFSP